MEFVKEASVQSREKVAPVYSPSFVISFDYIEVENTPGWAKMYVTRWISQKI